MPDASLRPRCVDGRDKPGHDDRGSTRNDNEGRPKARAISASTILRPSRTSATRGSAIPEGKSCRVATIPAWN